MRATVVDTSSRFSTPRRTPVPAAGVDVAEVQRQVRAYAFEIGCDVSNTTSAINIAINWGGTTQQAIQAGKRWADKKRAQQPDGPSAA